MAHSGYLTDTPWKSELGRMFHNDHTYRLLRASLWLTHQDRVSFSPYALLLGLASLLKLGAVFHTLNPVALGREQCQDLLGRPMEYVLWAPDRGLWPNE